ncbi:MAG: SCP2 sterol-binding domain-containing protein [Deltaproteobacteria bacterium]|nr:SCP2 sterol-binding domain-containing protein [Deltaproteobacteria bacterium]
MEVPKDISIKDLFLDFAPKMAQGALALGGKVDELAGTEFTLVVDVSGEKYRYIVKNGQEFDVGEGDLDAPMVRLEVSKDDLEKMIKNNELDMLLGIQSDLNKSKYDALSRIKGTMTAVLSNDDGSEYTIVAKFNNADTPKATFRLKTSDSAALARKEVNPVNLFMQGQMKIEGDMAFAMTTQPLFT